MHVQLCNLMLKKPLETYHRSCFVCLLKACASHHSKGSKKKTQTWDTATTMWLLNSRGEKNDVANDALPMWPPCQWRRRKIRVLTGEPGAPCRFFFLHPPKCQRSQQARPTGGGVKKLTSIRTLCWGIVNFKRESENEALSLKWNHRETTIMLLPMIYFGVCCDWTKGGRVPN